MDDYDSASRQAADILNHRIKGPDLGVMSMSLRRSAGSGPLAARPWKRWCRLSFPAEHIVEILGINRDGTDQGCQRIVVVPWILALGSRDTLSDPRSLGSSLQADMPASSGQSTITMPFWLRVRSSRVGSTRCASGQSCTEHTSEGKLSRDSPRSALQSPSSSSSPAEGGQLNESRLGSKHRMPLPPVFRLARMLPAATRPIAVRGAK